MMQNQNVPAADLVLGGERERDTEYKQSVRNPVPEPAGHDLITVGAWLHHTSYNLYQHLPGIILPLNLPIFYSHFTISNHFLKIS